MTSEDKKQIEQQVEAQAATADGTTAAEQKLDERKTKVKRFFR